MQDIVISDKEEFERKKERIAMDGLKNLFVVSDFDRTLTSAFHGNKKVSSLIAILREGDYLGAEYTKKATALFQKYHPFEIDMEISFEEKNTKMNEWWGNYNELFVEYRLSRKIINKIVEERKVGLRDGSKQFIKNLNKSNIPLLIASASSLGMVIDDYLEKNNVYFDNTKILTNYFNFDEKGVVVGVIDPIVTTTNKYLVINEHLAEIETVNNKNKNVLLLGDNYEDEKMANGFHCADIMKIGFLNEEVDENIDNYKRAFDVVILNDGKMDFVNEFIKDLS
ncbi:MAG: hypothetical protein PF572_05625 [Patescibacteria group bacterium]|jgi:HAD superfamily hydrolase (TIGR01544 family)|nr:hypothetical protein [Patescibacteria group bacterium]